MSSSNASMPNFELNRLSARDDASLLDEIRRVSKRIPGEKFSRVQFNELSRVHSSTLEKRFGSWRKALEAAGLALRSDTSNLRRSPEEVVKELKRVAAIVGTSELTKALFEQHANFKLRSVVAPFGTWSRGNRTLDTSLSPAKMYLHRYTPGESHAPASFQVGK